MKRLEHRSLMPRNRCPDLFLYCHLRTTLAERWKMDSVAVFSSPITYFIPLHVNPLVYTATKVPLEFTVISFVCIWNHVCRGHVCLEILSRCVAWSACYSLRSGLFWWRRGFHRLLASSRKKRFSDQVLWLMPPPFIIRLPVVPSPFWKSRLIKPGLLKEIVLMREVSSLCIFQ